MGHDKPTSNIRMRGVLLLPCGVTLSTMSNNSAKLGTAVTVAEAQQSIARAQAPKAAIFIQTTGQTYAVLSQSRSVGMGETVCGWFSHTYIYVCYIRIRIYTSMSTVCLKVVVPDVDIAHFGPLFKFRNVLNNV